MTQAQLEDCKSGEPGQRMDEVYRWELEAEESELEKQLTGELQSDVVVGDDDDDDNDDASNMKKLYQVPSYYREACRRLRGVNYVIQRISEKDQQAIKSSDVLYKLLESKLRKDTGDPRPLLLERVALYHWVLKTDLFSCVSLPFV